jgi:hypothetical protein
MPYKFSQWLMMALYAYFIFGMNGMLLLANTLHTDPFLPAVIVGIGFIYISRLF